MSDKVIKIIKGHDHPPTWFKHRATWINYSKDCEYWDCEEGEGIEAFFMPKETSDQL